MHRPPARLALAAVLAVLALLGLAPPLEAAREPKIPESMLAAEAGCGPGDEGRLIAIVDASAADDCDQTPEAVPASYVTARCICNHGTLVAVSPATDVSGLAPLAGADFTGPVTVTLDRGEDGDETLSFSSTLDEEVAEWTFAWDDADGSAYSLSFGADGADFGVVMRYAVSGNVAFWLGDGGVQFDSDDDGNFDATFAPTHMELGGVRFAGSHVGPASTGIDCDGTTAGDWYFDSTELQPCFCNGTNFVLFSDASTTCTNPE